MKKYALIGLAAVGFVLAGAISTGVVHAQERKSVYVVIDVAEFTDEALYKTMLSKSDAVNTEFGAKAVVQAANVTALDGAAPSRFIVLSFESAEKANAWYNSQGEKEVTAIRRKASKSRAFVVDALPAK